MTQASISGCAARIGAPTCVACGPPRTIFASGSVRRTSVARSSVARRLKVNVLRPTMSGRSARRISRIRERPIRLKFARGARLRALEDEVLDEVGHADAPLWLVPGAGLDPHADRHGPDVLHPLRGG